MKKIRKMNQINFCSLDQYVAEPCPCRCVYNCKCSAEDGHEDSSLSMIGWGQTASRGRSTADYGPPITVKPGVPPDFALLP